MSKRKKNGTCLILLGVVFILIPLLTNNNFIISTLTYCFVFAGFGVAWNLIGGYGAQISWCHSAFVAIGAYTGYLMYLKTGLSPFAAIPVGMLVSLGVATVIGYGTFRLRGAFFSLATIAFAEIVKIVLLYFADFTGGARGISIPYKGSSFLDLTFKNDIPFYYIMFGVMAAVLLITWLFERSKTGRYLGAIKGDEDAAISLGIKTFRTKLTAFQLSAVICSGIGTIYAFFLTYIDPLNICGIDLSIKIGICAIIGGLGTLWGPVLGAFLIIILTQVTSEYLGAIGGASLMLYGLIMVLIVIFRPAGIISFFVKDTEGNESVIGMIKKKISSKKTKEAVR